MDQKRQRSFLETHEEAKELRRRRRSERKTETPCSPSVSGIHHRIAAPTREDGLGPTAHFEEISYLLYPRGGLSIPGPSRKASAHEY